MEVRPANINYSIWDNKLEEKVGEFCAPPVKFRPVKGLRKYKQALMFIGSGHRKFIFKLIEQFEVQKELKMNWLDFDR